MRFFEILSDSIGWLQIVASPLIAGTFIGAIIYSSFENTLGIVLGISTIVVGLIIGIVWAIRVWKKKSTMEYLSRINSSHEIDKLD